MQEFMAFDRNLKLRSLTVFLTVLLGSAVGPNMTIYYVRYFGALITGILLLVIAASGFFAGLIGGYLADKIGRKPIMLIAAGMMITGYAIAMFVNSPWLVNHYITYLGFFLAAVGAAFADPADQAMMIDASTKENRNFVFALIYWIINIGVMIGAAIGGWFFRDYLFELLLGLVVVALINAVIVWLGMRETFFPEQGEAQTTTFLDGIKAYVEVLSDRRFMLFLLGAIAASTIMNQPDYYLATHLGESFMPTRLFGIDVYGQRMLSIMMVLNTMMVVTVFGIITRIANRFDLKRAFTVGIMLQGFGFAVSFLVQSFWPSIIATIVFTVGEMIGVAPGQTIRANLMNPAKIGAYSGAFSASRPAGMVVSSLMVSLSHFTGAWGMVIVMILLTLFAAWSTVKAAKMPAQFAGFVE
ncbi:MAG: MFS transporter [Lactobacillaceae bacterium]|jgi:DHA1 family multidrug resistance protein B-like MFS transporter|nr:MFS transporter [Lactobacillaceae bacterium]